MLLKDKALCRLAARFAISIAHCERWDDCFTCFMPGSTWEQRGFVQSICLFECSLILDLCGEWFTELGRHVVLRRIAEDGIGNLNFGTWWWEYIFHCNQLAWFAPGRILGYLLLEQTMPAKHKGYDRPVLPARRALYRALAVADLLENLNRWSCSPTAATSRGRRISRGSHARRSCRCTIYARARGKIRAGAHAAADEKNRGAGRNALFHQRRAGCDPHLRRDVHLPRGARLPRGLHARQPLGDDVLQAAPPSRRRRRALPARHEHGQHHPRRGSAAAGVRGHARHWHDVLRPPPPGRDREALPHGQQGRCEPHARGQGQLRPRVRRRQLRPRFRRLRLQQSARRGAEDCATPQHAHAVVRPACARSPPIPSRPTSAPRDAAMRPRSMPR